MPLLQDLVHRIESAAGSRLFRYAPAVLAVLLVALVYDLRQYKNFSTQEAMDSAQLARQIAQGQGYSTLYIRPLSMFLVQRTHETSDAATTQSSQADAARVRGEPHPDTANPPVYPVVLAGLMKLLPFDFEASSTKQFWSSGGRFWRYQPDFLIALFNQLLFGVVLTLAFAWALRNFDVGVAWTTTVVLLGTELLWQFSVSGLSTMLLLLIFMVLVWCLTLLEAEAREPRQGFGVLVGLAAAAGALVAAGALTRYAFGWLIIPTLLFVLFVAGPRSTILGLVTFALFAVAMTPWIVRNYLVCGAPFGTATYHVLEGTMLFPGSTLERSLSPNIEFFLSPIWAKLLDNLRLTLNDGLAQMGGNWVGGFFLVGLLVAFRKPGLRRIRYFLVTCLGLLIVVQALGRTELSDSSPEINSENLLVLALPLIVIYGVSLFFTLMDQIQFPTPAARAALIGVFGGLACLPMILSLFSRTAPLAYPPYHPLLIQQTAAWMEPDELIMSDIAWAVGWYGQRPCVRLTLNAMPNPENPAVQEDFFSVNDYYKPIHALYLTQRTTDRRLVSDWLRTGQYSWGHFVLDCILRKEVPPEFPLRQMPTGYLPEQLFLSDWKRWRQAEP